MLAFLRPSAILKLFWPEKLWSRCLVLTIILWIVWFIGQLSEKGEQAYIEVKDRFAEVSVNFQNFALQACETLRFWWITMESLGLLLAPFFVDFALLVRHLHKVLPLEVQLGAAGAILGAYLVMYSRFVRQALFIPIAGIMWLALDSFSFNFTHLVLPGIGIILPAIGSLLAFRRSSCGRSTEDIGFFLSYWFLFALTRAAPKRLYEFHFASEKDEWKINVILIAWLVGWRGSDIAFRIFMTITSWIWARLRHFGFVSKLVGVLSRLKNKLEFTKAKLQDEATAPTKQWKWVSRIQTAMKMGVVPLVIAGCVMLTGVMMMYKALSIASAAIVWPWILFEVGNVLKKETKSLYRAKLSLALLFLASDWTFQQSWFIVPKFILDFIRIPTILVLNMMGEMILDWLLGSQVLSSVNLVHCCTRRRDSDLSYESSERCNEDEPIEDCEHNEEKTETIIEESSCIKPGTTTSEGEETRAEESDTPDTSPRDHEKLQTMNEKVNTTENKENEGLSQRIPHTVEE